MDRPSLSCSLDKYHYAALYCHSFWETRQNIEELLIVIEHVFVSSISLLERCRSFYADFV